MKGYKNLLVWTKAHDLVLWVYQITKSFPKDELFGLTSQMRRAAVSVAANIVEGYARSSKKELTQFLYISFGSLTEIEYYLDLCRDLHYISPKEYALGEEKRAEVGRLLYGFIKSTRK